MLSEGPGRPGSEVTAHRHVFLAPSSGFSPRTEGRAAARQKSLFWFSAFDSNDNIRSDITTAPIRLRQRKHSDGINLVGGMKTSPQVPAVIICVLPGAG